MIEIKAIGGSSSRGNCYLLQSDSSFLLIECGFPIKRIRTGSPVRISSLSGCLISHEHGDHSRAVKDLLKMAVPCYMTRGTAEALGVTGHHRVHIIEAGRVFKIAGWTVLPFATVHDAVEPVGFVIQRGKERIFYATDTRYLKVAVEADYLMLECNYVLEILRRNVSTGMVPKLVKNRVLRTHMGLETLVKYLKKLRETGLLRPVKRIYLLHLSDLNSDENFILKTVQGITGKEVVII